MLGQNVGDIMGALQAACHPQHTARDYGAPEAFVDVSPDNHVYDAGFILERDKDDPLRGARALAQDDQACNRDLRVYGGQHQIRCRQAGGRARPEGLSMRGRCHENKDRTFVRDNQE